jgi:hypothetical protein
LLLAESLASNHFLQLSALANEATKIKQKVNQHTVTMRRIQQHHTEYQVVYLSIHRSYPEFKTLSPRHHKPLNKRLREKEFKSNYCSMLKKVRQRK